MLSSAFLCGTATAAALLPVVSYGGSSPKMAESPEEVAVLVQRVVKDINSAFKRNPHM